ncbi:MerR family transcriptional regulator [Nocardioides litoris]|uniref:MerR family transcriptional regulator n=1 Tax=Nocardioides litoris TaxID=1926648 RepID=UPI001120BC73|nr:MerR family transcriptional regulator [Nocardioides litoris]
MAQSPEHALQPVESVSLTIGDLSEQTGVSPATLRMWEIRYGFPDPRRRESGHRRYTPEDVDDVREIVRLRSEGLRLDAAVAQVVSRGDTRHKVAHETVAHRPAPPSHTGGDARIEPAFTAGLTEPAPSVYATVRRLHPEVAPQQLTKGTLKRLCWGMEDEFCSRALPGEIFGFFQETKYYRASRSRWTQVSALAHHAYAFAQFDEVDPAKDEFGPTLVDLPRNHVMTREWVLVCDAPGAPAVLSAWELPGQRGVAEDHRRFEAVWALDPEVVRRAAQACVAVAVELGAPGSDAVAERLAVAPMSAAQPTAASSMFGRVLAYTEEAPR